MIKINEHGSPRVVYGESGYLTETLWEICGTGIKKDFSKRYFLASSESVYVLRLRWLSCSKCDFTLRV